MTAIAGSWSFDGKPVEQDVSRQLAGLSVFGRHSQTQASFGPATLGRCLSLTVAEDRFDTQPLSSRNGRWHLVADARLDNRGALCRALGVTGEEAARLADSALILRAYERWGDACCDHLVGDYAFAVWDEGERSLRLFRDPLGKRPLYFHRSQTGIAFASMPQGLHALPHVPRGPDTELFTDLFEEMQHFGDRSFHKDIRKVKPGHMAIITEGAVHQHCHWNPQYTPDLTLSFADHVVQVRETLDLAVRSQIRGAPRIATQLSAGLDSSAVAVSAAMQMGPQARVDAYTAVPASTPDSASTTRLTDEGPMAAMTVAAYPNMFHHTVSAGTEGYLDSLHKATQLGAQPIYNLCNIRWIDAIHRQVARDGHSVMLTGATGNLTFSYGNDAYLSERLKRFQLLGFARDIAAIRKAGWKPAGTAAAKAVYRLLPRALLVHLEEWRVKASFLHGDRRAETHRALDIMTQDDWTQRTAYYRRADYHSADKATLAQFGVDVRDPTADRRLVELCLNIPPALFEQDGIPRAIGRSVLQGRVPDAVLNERRRGLQSADWHTSFVRDQEALGEQLEIIAEFEPLSSLLDVEAMQAALEELPSSGWNSRETSAQYRIKILRAVSYGDYFRRLSGSNR